MITPNQHVKFKEGFEKELLDEYQQLDSHAQIIMDDIARFCALNGVEFIVTDIMSDPEEDKKLQRISSSHSDGRAFDFRTWGKGWTKEFLDKLEKRFEHLYIKWAAISAKTGKPNLIYYHDNGNGKHAHCQIRKGI